MDKQQIEIKTIQITIVFLAIYYLLYSLYELPFVIDMYSCARLNICIYSELNLSNFYIFFFQVLKIFSSLLLFNKKFYKFALFNILSTNILFMFANKLLHSPEQGYLNFLLLILLLYKNPNSPDHESSPHQVFNLRLTKIYIFVFYLAYSFSGFTKYRTDAWMDGSFMNNFFAHNHLIYNTIFLEFLSTAVKSAMTYFTVFIELFSFLAITNRILALFFWLNLTIIQIGLIFWADLWQVNLGMLICHFFVMDNGLLIGIKKLLHSLKFKIFKI